MLQNSSDGDDLYKLLPLKVQVYLSNLRRRADLSVGEEVNANVADYALESRIIAMAKEDFERDMEGTDGLDAVERVGVK